MSDSNQGRDPSRFETIPSRPILQAAQRDRGIPLRLRPAGVPAVGRIFGKIVNCRVQASAKTAALPILSTTTGVTRTRALVRCLLPVFDRCRLARFRVIGRTRSCGRPLRTTISSSSVGSVGESKKDNDYRRFCDSWSYFGLTRYPAGAVSSSHNDMAAAEFALPGRLLSAVALEPLRTRTAHVVQLRSIAAVHQGARNGAENGQEIHPRTPHSVPQAPIF